MAYFQSSYRLVLASASPRRQQLMQQAGFPFEVRIQSSEEHYPDTLLPEEVAPYLAAQKAEVLRETLAPDELLIAADTVVILGERVLGKPTDEAEAFEMLSALSGTTHEVVTGVCLLSQEKKVVFHDTTHVTFLALTPEEIRTYLAECQPYDKAGAYGVQEWVGMVAVSHLNGSFYNVMGLPLHALYQQLKAF